MARVRWMKENAGELLPIVIAIFVPLAGIILALQLYLTGDRRRGLRVGAATLLGVCLYTAVFTI